MTDIQEEHTHPYFPLQYTGGLQRVTSFLELSHQGNPNPHLADLVSEANRHDQSRASFLACLRNIIAATDDRDDAALGEALKDARDLVAGIDPKGVSVPAFDIGWHCGQLDPVMKFLCEFTATRQQPKVNDLLELVGSHTESHGRIVVALKKIICASNARDNDTLGDAIDHAFMVTTAINKPGSIEDHFNQGAHVGTLAEVIRFIRRYGSKYQRAANEIMIDSIRKQDNDRAQCLVALNKIVTAAGGGAEADISDAIANAARLFPDADISKFPIPDGTSVHCGSVPN